MLVAVGIDLVTVDEVTAAIGVHGERYLQRVYTDDEQRDCEGDPRRLAGRFAAKEATMKALRRSDEPLPWRSIGVRLNDGGMPLIELSGPAAELARRQGITGISISLTDGPGVAAAVAIAEGVR